MTLPEELAPHLKAIVNCSLHKGSIDARSIRRSISAFRDTSVHEIRSYFLEIEQLGYGHCNGVGSRMIFTASDVASNNEAMSLEKKRIKKKLKEIVVQAGVVLTKREYFAAMALQGLLSNPKADEIVGSNSYGFIALKVADELILSFQDYPEGY